MSLPAGGIDPNIIILDTLELRPLALTDDPPDLATFPLKKSKAHWWKLFGWVAGVGLAVFVIVNFLWLLGVIQPSEIDMGWLSDGLAYVQRVAIVVGLLLIPILLLYGYFLLPLGATFHAVKKGQYDKALRRAQFFRRLPLPKYGELGLFNEGSVQSFAGNFAEAEPLLWAAIDAQGEKLSAATTYENLGIIYLHQGRFMEAARSLNRALELSPKAGGMHGSMATVYLWQGLNPARALLLLQRGLKLKKNPLHIKADKYQICEMWMDVAWAYELLGRRAESDAAMQQAFMEGTPKFIPTRAGLYWRIGQIMRLRGYLVVASENYQQAIDTDSTGAYGKLAAQSLKELGY